MIPTVFFQRKPQWFFNFGVNDWSKSADYAEYYNWIKITTAKSKDVNCTYVCKSGESSDAFQCGKSGQKWGGSQIIQSVYEANLSSAYTYIDVFLSEINRIQLCQWSLQNRYGRWRLHYTTRTYKRIFAKCMDSLRVPAWRNGREWFCYLTKKT